MVFNNYKLPELYSIIADEEEYKKYINALSTIVKEYSDKVDALSALHTEAFSQSMKKKEEIDAVKSMSQIFDCISEADQKRFCECMMKKSRFFEDAYKMMMDSFENAVEVKNDDVEVCEKMQNGVRK